MSAAKTVMPPLMPSETASVRRTVASTVAIELTEVTGPIRLTISTASAGSVLSAATEALTGLHLQQVGAQGSDPGLQFLTGRRRQPEHAHHRGDADGHAERRQASAQPPGAQAECADAQDVGRAQVWSC